LVLMRLCAGLQRFCSCNNLFSGGTISAVDELARGFLRLECGCGSEEG
jgi:hypothetical protein